MSTSVLLVSAVLVPLSGAAPVDPVSLFDANVAVGESFREGELIVSVVPGTQRSAVESMAHELGCEVRKQAGHHPVYVVRCGATPLRRSLASWAASSEVVWVDASWSVTAHLEPDDLIEEQWHHLNSGQTIVGTAGTPGADIDSTSAWEVQTGDPAVVVAVLDSGVRLDHEDLEPNLWRNELEVCDDGVDDDGNGYVDDCHGWDSADDDADVDPTALPSSSGCAPYHGTAISCLAAASGDNGLGGVGVMWRARVMPLKVMADADCSTTVADLVDALYYAADNGAQVLNFSLSFTAEVPLVEEAFEYLDDQGVIAVISAGNSATDLDGATWYPHAYDLDRALVVASTTNLDLRATSSNYGEESVDLGAPGKYLRTCGISSTSHYQTQSGTSVAAPLVAGAAGLLLSEYPWLDADEVVQAILGGVAPLDDLDCSLVDECVASGGRLDLAGALETAAGLAGPVELAVDGWEVLDDGAEGSDGDGDGVAEAGERLAIAVVVRNDGTATSAGVEAVLSVDADAVEVVDDQVSIGAVPAGGSVDGSPDVFLVDAGEPCVANVPVTLTAVLDDGTSSWLDPLVLDVVCDQDRDDDGWLGDEDCDDADPLVYPGADELCDEVDQDCDEEVDEDAVDAAVWYPDSDGDGFGDPVGSVASCDPPAGHVDDATDCDDADPTAYPGAEGWTEDCHPIEEEPPEPAGCGCTAGGEAPGWLAVVVLWGRRRRSPAGSRRTAVVGESTAASRGRSGAPPAAAD